MLRQTKETEEIITVLEEVIDEAARVTGHIDPDPFYRAANLLKKLREGQ